MLTAVTIGRTVYKVHNTSDMFSLHNKCTGKHKPFSHKREKRNYPAKGHTMSPAEYVMRYEAMNQKGFARVEFEPLAASPSIPQGEDLFEENAE